MNRKTLTLAIAMIPAMLLTGTVSHASSGVHWGYEGKSGPRHWMELEEDFALCGQGKNQSPVNLSQMVDAKLPPLQIDYQGTGTEVINNGHTIQVNYQPGSTLVVDGDRFELKQFHFHSPSENRINGKAFPLEGHFVHADKNGNLAVIAVMFEEGQANDVLSKVWEKMPASAGGKSRLKQTVSANDLLPAKRDYYRFNGSLTTPPCTEGVRWFVMKQPVTISGQQVKKFSHVMHHPNNREVQPLNARVIME